MSDLAPQDQAESSAVPPAKQSLGQVMQGTIQFTQQVTQSNLPAPDLIAGYEKILPGSAERLLRLAERAADMSEKEQSHIHKLQEIEVQARIEDRKSERKIEAKGQILGFVFGVVGIVGAVILGIQNQPVPSSLLGSISVGSIAIALIRGRNFRNR